jgi:hypothetical protein
MSQQLTPVNGGVIPQVQTTTAPDRLNVLSSVYIDIKSLQNRPTEWVPGGRPIYRRLPATSETYQINFFNLVSESNILSLNKTLEGIEKIGYVYTPYGESVDGPLSTQVVAAEGNKALLIKAGAVVWEYGKDEVLPAIIDLQTIDLGSGRYDIAYQLIYDDAPSPKIYQVEDFDLTGQPLNITSSTDSIIGWRYPAVNAFRNTSTTKWSNEDTYFPSYAQIPSGPAYLEWSSELTAAYSDITLRCPPQTAYSGSATLYYVSNGVYAEVETVNVSSDSSGQYFKFQAESPVFQTGWKVEFSSTTVSIQSVTVSGQLTLLEKTSGLRPLTRLVLYKSGALPETVITDSGREVPATYCKLAIVDVGTTFNVLKVEDQRQIIHRDYTPVADWLTKPFDESLIDLYEQVTDYPNLWMAPPTCMKQEYAGLTEDLITVEA